MFPHAGMLQLLAQNLDPGGPYRTVDQGHAEEQKTAGKDTQQMVLEAGLVGRGRTAGKPGQCTQGQRHQLEPQKDDEQIRRRGHEHHAQRGHHQQQVVLPPVQTFPGQIGQGQEHGQDGAHQKEDIAKRRIGIQDDHPVKRLDGQPLPPLDQRDGQYQQGAEEGQIARVLGGAARPEHRLHTQHHQGQAGECQFREERHPFQLSIHGSLLSVQGAQPHIARIAGHVFHRQEINCVFGAGTDQHLLHRPLHPV